MTNPGNGGGNEVSGAPDDFLGYLAGWAERWSTDPESMLTLQFTMSPADWDKRSAWITAESPARMGNLTLWGSGELQVEVVEAASMESVHAVSVVVDDTDALSLHLKAFIEWIERVAEVDRQSRDPG